MSSSLSRRRLLAGASIATGAVGLTVAARLARRYGLIPPDSGGIFGATETLTYASQRILMARHPLAREFDRSQISRATPINGDPPEDETYQRLQKDDFANWKISVEGLVARPASFTLAELKRLPARTQITHLACEEGWSFIAEWTGVPLSYILNLTGVLPQARYVAFFPFDISWDSVDMGDALHPQTLLAYAMNGQMLTVPHGAPLRLRVARQLGYKSVKYLSRMLVTETLKSIRNGLGSISPDLGYSWYAGI